MSLNSLLSSFARSIISPPPLLHCPICHLLSALTPSRWMPTPHWKDSAQHSSCKSPECILSCPDPIPLGSQCPIRDLGNGAGISSLVPQTQLAGWGSQRGLRTPRVKEMLVPGSRGSELQVTAVRNRPPRAIPTQKGRLHRCRWQGNEAIQD